MPDVLGGMLARQVPPSRPSTLGALGQSLNYLNPLNIARLMGQGLLGGAQTTQKFMQGEPVSIPEVLSASTMGVSGGLLAPPGGTALGAGPIRRGFVQGGKSLVEDLQAGRLGLFDSSKAKTIIAKTKEQKGYSVNLKTGEVPEEGLLAGKYRNTDPRTTVLDSMRMFTPKQAEAHAAKNAKILGSTDHMFGTWEDPADGKVYLDVSKKFPAKGIRPATKFAEKTAQKNIYNAATGETPPVGNFPDFITGKTTPPGVVPYSTRLQEMGAEGRMYMHGQPTSEWWRQPNMERVYGAQNMPQIRGLLAATSTNTQPAPNVVQMSEYARRMIKGEPMRQPGYRVPEGSLSGFGMPKPGAKMSLEANRKFNLETAASGATDPAAYHGDVVPEKVGALSGNPATIVLDRIQTRLGEQPSSGIFATSKEGKSPGGKDRQTVLRIIRQEAKIAGEDPDTFSGNVWAGAREHVSRTGELYGTPLKKTQLATAGTESKSYDDLFMDRVREKAKHLGISVRKMEKQLRNGDAELLSHILVPTTALGAGGLLYGRDSQ